MGTEDVLRNTVRDRERILSPFQDEATQWTQRLVFDHGHDTPLLSSATDANKNKAQTQKFTLSYANSAQFSAMATPVMKAKSSNTEISKSLLDYVIGTSMKGGKH